MLALLVDADIRGHARVLEAGCKGAAWGSLWSELGYSFLHFEDVGLDPGAPDSDIWEMCQQHGLILLTGNRNLDGPTSLEATIRARATLDSLPVLTLADADRALHDREYVEHIVARLIEILLYVDQVRGSGRLFLP